MDRKTKQTSTILLVASVLSQFLGLWIVMFVIRFHGGFTLAGTDAQYDFLRVMQYWLLLVVIPGVSVVWGIRHQIKRNIIVGLIFASLLTIFGIFGIQSSREFFTDYSYVTKLGETIGFEFPESGEFMALTYEGEPISTNGTVLTMDAVVRYDEENARILADRIQNDPRFVAGLSPEAQTAIPLKYSDTCRYNLYDAYMLYSEDSGVANAPTEDDRSFIYLLYDQEHNAIVIYRFTL